MRKIDGGMDEETKQRLAKMLRVDDSGNSASDDDGSVSEVGLPFPPDLWLVGACVLRKRDDAGAGVVAKIRGLRHRLVGRVVGWWHERCLGAVRRQASG